MTCKPALGATNRLRGTPRRASAGRPICCSRRAQVDELVAVCAARRRLGLPYLVLGGGANVLVSDAGVRGLVMVNRAKRIKFTARNGAARVEVDSGVSLITLARDCIERGYAGLEWAISVPGTVGGAVVGNAGAHGADLTAIWRWPRSFGSARRRRAGMVDGPADAL